MDKRPEKWKDYIHISHAIHNLEELLTKYEVSTLHINTDLYHGLIAAATVSPHWQLAYENEQFVVFEQRGGA